MCHVCDTYSLNTVNLQKFTNDTNNNIDRKMSSQLQLEYTRAHRHRLNSDAANAKLYIMVIMCCYYYVGLNEKKKKKAQ